MSPFWWAAVFGGILVLAALVISVVCLRAFAAEDAALMAGRKERDRKWYDLSGELGYSAAVQIGDDDYAEVLAIAADSNSETPYFDAITEVMARRQAERVEYVEPDWCNAPHPERNLR